MKLDGESLRILKVAQDLFHREGITATGVQRISTAAGISKRTLYERFGSKDRLVVLVLQALDVQVYGNYTGAAEAVGTDPAARLDALFAAVEARTGQDDFRGCPFINFAAEIPEPADPARGIIRAHKERLRGWIEQQLRAGHAVDPVQLSQQLAVLFDGAMALSGLTHDAEPATAARRLASAKVRDALSGAADGARGTPRKRRPAEPAAS